ncbi:hypothetical protein ElyMa_001440500 [Elysia marginata]|uniref:Uncharacterized protein n=1 Tax=Elysia marginata TaxID=1093978 RepID=A0AAV4IX92_9GAST|nr:hypothetical protein ElyMa_001440500 [Elysia marginata]
MGGQASQGEDRAKLTSTAAIVNELTNMLKERLELPKEGHPRKIKYQCGNINYSTNSYDIRKPCLGAECKEKFNRTYEDRVKDVVLSSRYQLENDQLDAILSLGRSVPVTDVIIVSAVSSNHFDEMQMMFKNLHETVFPTLHNFRVVLFDIGLSPEQRRLSLVDRARKLVIWQDASVRWRSQYKDIFDRANLYGLQVFLGGGDKVTANTLHETFEYMQERECLFEAVPEIANAVAVYKADTFNKLAVLTPWARCALEPSCVCPQDPNVVRYCGKLRPLRCHRFDQSALTLLLAKLFYDQRFRFEIQQPENYNYVEIQRKTLAPNYFQNINR